MNVDDKTQVNCMQSKQSPAKDVPSNPVEHTKESARQLRSRLLKMIVESENNRKDQVPSKLLRR
jgi:hypothetical protein